MKRFSVFFTGLVLSLYRHIGSIVIAVILLMVGAIWSRVCFFIGLALLAANLLVAILAATRMQKLAANLSKDDPAFNNMLEKLMSDPDSLLSEAMEVNGEHCDWHGEQLLTLSEDELFSAVFAQNREIAAGAEDETQELARFDGARRTVYILATLDAEVQNGGLCQFFVNSSRVLAPYVSEALAAVGATEHRELFEHFITTNHIDLSDLDSFVCRRVKEYAKQVRRFDFDSFDDAYYDLPPLQEKTVAYIKANIQEF